MMKNYEDLLGKKVRYIIDDAYFHFNSGTVVRVDVCEFYRFALIEKDGDYLWFSADLLEVIE